KVRAVKRHPPAKPTGGAGDPDARAPVVERLWKVVQRFTRSSALGPLSLLPLSTGQHAESRHVRGQAKDQATSVRYTLPPSPRHGARGALFPGLGGNTATEIKSYSILR